MAPSLLQEPEAPDESEMFGRGTPEAVSFPLRSRVPI